MKNEQGGYASNIEKYVVGNVVKANILPGAVINVILHYFCVMKTMISLAEKSALGLKNSATNLLKERSAIP